MATNPFSQTILNAANNRLKKRTGTPFDETDALYYQNNQGKFSFKGYNRAVSDFNTKHSNPNPIASALNARREQRSFPEPKGTPQTRREASHLFNRQPLPNPKTQTRLPFAYTDTKPVAQVQPGRQPRDLSKKPFDWTFGLKDNKPARQQLARMLSYQLQGMANNDPVGAVEAFRQGEQSLAQANYEKALQGALMARDERRYKEGMKWDRAKTLAPELAGSDKTGYRLVSKSYDPELGRINSMIGDTVIDPYVEPDYRFDTLLNDEGVPTVFRIDENTGEKVPIGVDGSRTSKYPIYRNFPDGSLQRLDSEDGEWVQIAEGMRDVSTTTEGRLLGYMDRALDDVKHSTKMRSLTGQEVYAPEWRADPEDPMSLDKEKLANAIAVQAETAVYNLYPEKYGTPEGDEIVRQLISTYLYRFGISYQNNN